MSQENTKQQEEEPHIALLDSIFSLPKEGTEERKAYDEMKRKKDEEKEIGKEIARNEWVKTLHRHQRIEEPVETYAIQECDIVPEIIARLHIQQPLYLPSLGKDTETQQRGWDLSVPSLLYGFSAVYFPLDVGEDRSTFNDRLAQLCDHAFEDDIQLTSTALKRGDLRRLVKKGENGWHSYKEPYNLYVEYSDRGEIPLLLVSYGSVDKPQRDERERRWILKKDFKPWKPQWPDKGGQDETS